MWSGFGVIGSQTMQKRINLAQVMRSIRGGGMVSRADIARRTGLTKSTVSNLVRELIECGLLVEHAELRGGAAGRPPILLGLANEPWIAGLDIRPDRVRMVGLSLSGTVCVRDEFAVGADPGDDRTSARGWSRGGAASVHNDPSEYDGTSEQDDQRGSLAAAAQTARGLLSRYLNRECLGISIAVPATVNPVTGEIIDSEEFGPAAGVLDSDGYGDLPVAVENDANAVAWTVVTRFAEAPEGLSNANAMVVMGRRWRKGSAMRIGTALVIDGRVYYGSRFTAGEFRSVRWRSNHEGELAGATSSPGGAGGTGSIDWELELLESLAPVVSMLRPDVIVFAGDLAGESQRLQQVIHSQLAGSVIDPQVSGIPILEASDAGWSVARGAASMFLEHLFALPSADRVRPQVIPYWDLLSESVYR